MITDGEKWHFTSVKNEQRLFRDAFSKHHDAYYCLNCRQSYRTDKSLKKHERLCLNNKDCHVKLPNKNNNTLKYEKDMRSIKSPHIIYADLECLLKNIYDNTNVNENESYQIKNNLHVPCGYGINFVRSYDKNILTYYRGTDCTEKFVKSIKLICSIIINTKQALHKQLAKKQTYEYNKCDKCIVCKKNFKDNKYKNIKYCYFTGEYIGASHKYCDKKVIEVPVAFHNGSNYNYHFIIKELAKKVDGLVCIGENSEKYITFKATININEIEIKLKFIDTFRVTFNSLDTLVNNLTELNKCKECNKECNNYIIVKNTIKYSCNKCKKVSYRSIDNLISKCSNVYSICNGDLDKFFIIIKKRGILYPYEYMNSWNKFNETNNPPFEKYYSRLNMSNISKEDYLHSQKIWSIFNIKNIGEYHDLYVKTDVLLLTDVSENFRKMCYNIYELDPIKYVSAPNLAFQACLKKTNKKLELLTDMDMLLMFEDGIRGGVCQAIILYLKANNKYLKNYNKSIHSSFVKYLDANNLYGWAMCKKLPIKDFKWGNINNYNESIIKNYDVNGDYSMIFDVDINYPEEIALLHEELAFLPERKKINGVNKLVTTLENNKRYIVHLITLKQALNYGLKF